MISGKGGLLASSGVWAQLEAAHAFPPECEILWNESGYSRWVTNMEETTGISKINALQNGLLMKRDLHSIFDQYLLFINPDACTLRRFCILGILARAYWHDIGQLYNIVSFATDKNGIDGSVLEPACRDPTNPNRISNEFLRRHFHQSVLATCVAVGSRSLRQTFPLVLTRSKHWLVNHMARNGSRWRWACVCGVWLETNR